MAYYGIKPLTLMVRKPDTSQVGYNLVASATSPNNMRLISVVMGVPTYKGREVESKNSYNGVLLTLKP